MPINTQTVLQEIDQALEEWHTLLAKAQHDDCSDQPEQDAIMVTNRLASTIDRLAPPGSLHKRSLGHNQARELNTWARLQELPIITIGDFNFDWNFIGDHSRDNGYDLLTKDDVFAWVRPDILTPTQCHETFKSVLDFAFVAGEAKQWPREAEILERQPDYCPDTDQKADHRPIRLVISVP